MLVSEEKQVLEVLLIKAPVKTLAALVVMQVTAERPFDRLGDITGFSPLAKGLGAIGVAHSFNRLGRGDGQSLLNVYENLLHLAKGDLFVLTCDH